MNKYEEQDLITIQNTISRKNSMIEKLRLLEITEDKDLSDKIEAEEADLVLLLAALSKKDQKPKINSNDGAIQSYERATKITELDNALKRIKKFGPGVSAEDFLENLDHQYHIYVKSQLNEFPYLEQEFVKRCTSSMNGVYISQMLNSGENIETFKQFKAYVISNYGTKRSNFQVLNDCFSLQPHDGESYSDFAARLDISVRKASSRIVARHKAKKKTATNPDPVVSPEVCFELTGALLMAQVVQRTNKPVYDLMCQKMDEYEDAIKVGAEAQKLYDRGVRSDGDVEIINYGSSGNAGKYGSASGHAKLSNSDASNKGRSTNGNRSGKPGGKSGKPNKKGGNSKSGTNPDGTCKWGSKCFKFPKGTCPYPHKDTNAHAADAKDGEDGGFSYNGYTYEYQDFRPLQA